MTTAHVEAGRAYRNAHWINLAQATYRFISESMADDNRVAHAARNDKRVNPAMATDYANMIEAALSLREVTRDAAYLNDATRSTAAVDAYHREEDSEAYAGAANDATDILARMRSAADDATPNTSPTMVRNQIRDRGVRLRRSCGDHTPESGWRCPGQCIHQYRASRGL